MSEVTAVHAPPSIPDMPRARAETEHCPEKPNGFRDAGGVALKKPAAASHSRVQTKIHPHESEVGISGVVLLEPRRQRVGKSRIAASSPSISSKRQARRCWGILCRFRGFKASETGYQSYNGQTAGIRAVAANALIRRGK
ncbi:hypothetical protein [Pararhizobium gei]|uniref:hypothetical protein n=1 Tax=Pararhizobium gei TaxID=1395951 RepID=UPI0023D98E0D|nr:hypothetical protein [Rhizobium gei]